MAHFVFAIGKRVCVAVLTCGLMHSSWAQRPPLPATKPGQLAGDWMKLCRSPNLAQMAQWLTENLSEESQKRFPTIIRAQIDVALCTDNGGFRVAGVTRSEPATISSKLVGLKSGVWFTQTFDLNEAGKLNLLGVYPAIYPSEPIESTLPTDLSDATIASSVRSWVNKLSEIGLFSGIVTVARGTRIIASVNGGFANRERETPIAGSTQFTLGSMGKMFTAVAIGQLVDRGKMSFGDTVGKFFPAYPNRTVRDSVTVGMLLSHTGGMGDFLGKRTPNMMKMGVKRAAEFMPLYDSEELQFAPGTSWAYSNAGFALLGAIVERVSGEDYPDYLRKHIFAVAGMTSSDPNNIPHSTATLATPYTKQTDHGPSSDWHEAEHDIGSPAGGAISTADDLVRFANALRTGKLVNKKTFAEMTKPRGNPPDMKYGYGMQIEEMYGRTIVGHGGGFPGVSTHLYLLLESPYTVVVLANQDPPADAYAGTMVVALMAEKAKLGK